MTVTRPTIATTHPAVRVPGKRRFAHQTARVFASRLSRRSRRSTPLRVPWRDGTDPLFGGQRADGPRASLITRATEVHRRGAAA
jgi:hypothetical protein